MPDVVSAAGQRIGPYTIDTEIGRGAHGIVYRARHRERLETLVALKVVENRGQLDKLLVEPEILSKLRHPGIVGLDDYFLDGDRLVVALEFIAGQDLKAYLERRGVLPPNEVREFLRQMAAALQHAHAAGVLHRDIKLSNILVEERDGRPPRFVLTDFGISRLADGIQVTRHGGGTYLFMAPEQLRGRPEKPSDLWSLGVVAYVLLTGQQPFGGTTLAELSHEVFFTIPKPPRDVQPSAADESLERIVYGLLEKQVTARTTSAAELVAALRDSLESPPVPFAASPEVAPARELTYDRRLQAKIRRHWVGFWVAAILLAGPCGCVPQLFVLGGAFLFWKGQASLPGTSRWTRTLTGLALMNVGTFVSWIFLLAGLVPSAQLIGVLVLVWSLAFAYLAVYYFATASRLKRELNLRRAITASLLQPGAYALLLRGLLEQTPEDLRLQQRYVEALLAQGQTRDAAVEAKLLLEHDPYDFGGSLLLAQSYFDLGLHVQCAATCDAYLDVTGYCFEFEELKTRCAIVS